MLIGALNFLKYKFLYMYLDINLSWLLNKVLCVLVVYLKWNSHDFGHIFIFLFISFTMI